MEIKKIIEKYDIKREVKELKIRTFFDKKNKKENFLIIQEPENEVFSDCNTIQKIFTNNLLFFDKYLNIKYSDQLPYIEPWIGVGVYANAFGSQYKWRNNNAPDAHYVYHKIDEIKNLKYPDYKKSSIMNMVLNSIEFIKEKTFSKLPISLTDTQSPFDTATLVLDTSEFFTACYTDEEIIHKFMQIITDLIIEFSKEQIKAIVDDLIAKPGHIMPSLTNYRGIALSDDNLAVSSPLINKKIGLPYNYQLGDEFGGLAIHSCGKWEHTMALLKEYKNTMMIDCAGSLLRDPNPNDPKLIKEAMKNTDIIVKIRMGHDLNQILDFIDKIFDKSIKLIIQFPYEKAEEEIYYKTIEEKLLKMYEQ